MDNLVTQENIQEILEVFLIEFLSSGLSMEIAKEKANMVYLRWLDLQRIKFCNIIDNLQKGGKQ